MKKIFVPLLLVVGLVLVVSCAASNTLKKGEKNEMLVGEINQSNLQVAPFAEWYKEYYQNHKLNKVAIKKFKDKIKDCNIEIFMGTWCGDSHRQVPAFYKVLEETNFPLSNVKLYAVNRNKKTGLGVENNKNIERVPTFIFYKNGKEIGRIVETPKKSLESDILNIVQ